MSKMLNHESACQSVTASINDYAVEKLQIEKPTLQSSEMHVRYILHGNPEISVTNA